MKVRNIFNIINMEIGEVNILALVTLFIFTLIAYHQLILDGYLDFREPLLPPNYIASRLDSAYLDREGIEFISRLSYLVKKSYVLNFNSLLRLLVTPSASSLPFYKINTLFLFLGIAAYVSMSSSDIFKPGVYKRFMTLPITRGEYFIGKLLLNVMVGSVVLTSTYILIASILYKFDIYVLLASLYAIPVISLFITASYLISAIVRSEIPSFILSTGGMLFIHYFILDGLVDIMSIRVSEDIVASPLYGYLISLAFEDEVSGLGKFTLVLRNLLYVPNTDVDLSIQLFIMYELILLLATIGLIYFSGRVLSRVEVD